MSIKEQLLAKFQHETRNPQPTPGPWVVLKSDALDEIAVTHDSRFSVPLAVLRKDDFLDRRAANARLIAAAPEMLKVLQELIDDPDNVNYRHITAIIDKVKGDI